MAPAAPLDPTNASETEPIAISSPKPISVAALILAPLTVVPLVEPKSVISHRVPRRRLSSACRRETVVSRTTMSF
jgi:hypothetical protein